MNIVSKLTIKTMHKNRSTALTTIIGIILSVSLTTGLFIFAHSFITFRQEVEILRNGDSHLQLFLMSREELENLPNREMIEKEAVFSLMGEQSYPESDRRIQYAGFIGYNPENEKSMPLKLLKGSLPSKAGDIVISEDVSRTYEQGLKLGDWLEVELEQASSYWESRPTFLKTGKILRGQVVGITESRMHFLTMSSAYYVYQSPEEIAEAERFWVGVRLKDLSEENLRRFTNGLDQAGLTYYLTELLSLYPQMPSSERVFVYAFATVLAVIVAIAAISLIQNSFYISLSQRMKELSLLSSIGMTRRQKWQMTLTEGFLLFLIAFPLGLVAGVSAMLLLFKLIAPMLQRMMRTEAMIHLTWNTSMLALIFVFTFMTLIISSFIPALKSSRQSPLAGIRQTDEVKVKAKDLKTPGYVRKLFAFEGDLAWKNLKRNKRRYRATLLPLVLSLTLYLSMASVISYAATSAGVGMSMSTRSGDIEVFSHEKSDLLNPASFESLTQMDGVKNFKSNYQLYAFSRSKDNLNTDGSWMSVWVDEDTQLFRLRLMSVDMPRFQSLLQAHGLSEEDLGEGKALLINRTRVRTQDGIKEDVFYHRPPQSVEIQFANKKGGQTFKLDIVKTLDEALDDVSSWMGTPLLLVSLETLQNMSRYTNEIEMSICINSEAEKHENLLRQMRNYKDEHNLYIEINDWTAVSQNDKDLLMLARILFLGFATVLALISLTNIFNSIIASLRLRKKEFAMLRAVGMEEKSFRKMIRFESYFYAFKVLVYGFLLGTISSYLIYKYLSRTIAFTFYIPVGHFALAALVVIDFLLVVMNLGSGNARRGNILETLKLELDL